MSRPALQTPRRRAGVSPNWLRPCRFEQMEPRRLMAGDWGIGTSIALDPVEPNVDGPAAVSSLAGRVVQTAARQVDVESAAQGPGIAGVTIRLLDERGQEVARTSTDADGDYAFSNLAPGLYALLEVQPASWSSGASFLGSAGGQRLADNLLGEIDLGEGVAGRDYLFCEFLIDQSQQGDPVIPALELNVGYTSGYVPAGEDFRAPIEQLGQTGVFWIEAPDWDQAVRAQRLIGTPYTSGLVEATFRPVPAVLERVEHAGEPVFGGSSSLNEGATRDGEEIEERPAPIGLNWLAVGELLADYRPRFHFNESSRDETTEEDRREMDDEANRLVEAMPAERAPRVPSTAEPDRLEDAHGLATFDAAEPVGASSRHDGVTVATRLSSSDSQADRRSRSEFGTHDGGGETGPVDRSRSAPRRVSAITPRRAGISVQ